MAALASVICQSQNLFQVFTVRLTGMFEAESWFFFFFPEFWSKKWCLGSIFAYMERSKLIITGSEMDKDLE